MLTTYDIFDNVLEMRSLFEDLLNKSRSVSRNIDYPYINISEQNDSIEISAVLPGVKPEDVNIQLVQDSIIIEGERKSDIQDKPYMRRERDFGKFKKSLKLPYRVDNDNINASLKDGMLYVKLMKSEEAKPKKIQIQ